MLQRIDKKKIFIYIFFLLFLSTLNNQSLINLDIFNLKITQIKVSGLSNEENLKTKKSLNYLIFQNILFIKKKHLSAILDKNKLVHSYKIKKIYPNSIEIIIKKTELLATTNLNESFFYVGSNAKLIKTNSINKNLPYVFGKFDTSDFINFIKTINLSNFNIDEISQIYFFKSNRWDILTNNGILFKLPNENLIIALNKAHQITNSKNFNNIKIIDLRIAKHIILTNE
jgi:cell division septal protein FtsQ